MSCYRISIREAEIFTNCIFERAGLELAECAKDVEP